jgi:ParB family chromosome partitioning protein
LSAGKSGGEILAGLERLRANPGQPRRRFDRAELEALAASIKTHGIIQPIIVDEDEEGRYVIIAGERRSRAAALAGLTEVPVIVRRYSDQKRLEVALVENIHRADLNPIEEAAAYRQLMETGGLSQDEAAERVGKSRSAVANALRLLKLPAKMREALEEGTLTAGHARAILSLPQAAGQETLFDEINAGGLSVREAEKRAGEIAAALTVRGGKAGSGGKGGNGKDGDREAAKRDPELKTMEERFIEKLGTKVTIHGTLKKGRVEIDYYSMDDLDRLYGLLGT